MITFPTWVEGARGQPRPTDEELAQRRMRYLILRTSIECTESGSVASLADFCGVERVYIHTAIRNGCTPTNVATKIEKACGRKIVRREWLMFPLEIEELAH
jgi:hypothetical protein